MRLTSGKVVAGQIVVEGEPLPEGSVVTILARDADESFEVNAALQAKLLQLLTPKKTIPPPPEGPPNIRIRGGHPPPLRPVLDSTPEKN